MKFTVEYTRGSVPSVVYDNLLFTEETESLRLHTYFVAELELAC